MASRIPVRYYANPRATTAFRKYWENVGCGPLKVDWDAAQVPRKCSQGSPFPANIYLLRVRAFNSVCIKCLKCIKCMYQRPRLEETRDRDREPFQSRAGNLWEFLLSDRKENNTSLLRFKMQSASSRFACLSESTKHLFSK